MASIIEGYNYDIFISYRQKDNKHDGWVTDFVDNLKGELESTFKEDISVYFDINPHDGLLETHDVGASLKEKLKCLIFIPIISRTYCDPKSFAWEHEFRAFVEQASNDKFGLKVKLPNGNVASRVLPVQIHDLDNEDITRFESVLGSVLRGIEFIYKEAGIDKPLSPDDDEKKNLNKTKYRIQIVKVAHGIKEIIDSARQPEPVIISEIVSGPAPEIKKDRKTRIIVGAAIALLLIILGIIFIPKLFKPETYFGNSIAVLPFKSLSDDPEQEYFSDGITEDILNNLAKIADLSVKSRTSTIQYKNSDKSIPVIGDELGVDIILEGTVRKSDNKVRIVAQLIDVKKDVHIWSETFDREITDIFSVQSEIALEIARTLQASLTESEIRNISKEASMDITAYDYYLRGRQMEHDWNGDKNALDNIVQLYKQAIDLDPEFALGYYGIGRVLYYDMRRLGVPTELWLDSAFILSEKAIRLDPSLPEGYILRSSIYQNPLGKTEESKKDLQTAYKLAPNNPDVLRTLGNVYLNEGDYKVGASMIVKSIELQYTKKEPDYFIAWGNVYRYTGEFDKSELLYKQAIRLNSPSSPGLLGDLYLFNIGKYPEARKVYEDILEDNPLQRGIIDRLGWINLLNGNLDRAEEYWSKYKELEDQFSDTSQYVPFRHRLAYVKWLKGEKDEAISLFHEQLKRDMETYSGIRGYGIWNNRSYYYDLGAVNAFLGNKEEAYLWLDSAANYGWFGLWYVDRDSLLNPIRNEDRFQVILKKKKAEADQIQIAFTEVMDESGARDQLKWFFDSQ